MRLCCTLILMSAVAGACAGAALAQGQLGAAAGQFPSAADAQESPKPAGAADPTAWAPLLREGSHLVDVVAELVRDPRRQAWRIRIEPDAETNVAHELTLLPNARLAEMQRMVETSDGESAVFRITGDVYVFHDRNYLLVTHAPQIVRLSVEDEAEQPEARADDDGSSDSSDSSTAQEPVETQLRDADDDDSVEAIMRGLRQSVGELPRGTSAGTMDGGSGATADAAASPLDEGTMLVNRRGRVRRDEFGAWMFVLDADAEGLADPPLVLLPCMLLETIERRTREEGMHVPLILTGRKSVYEGRRFLLTTMLIVPRDRTVLAP